MPTKAILIIIMWILLAGCSASGVPRLIASYPYGGAPLQPPPPAYPLPQAFVYNARLALEAWRPSRAADIAVDLAAHYGGYLVSTHTWRQAGEEHLSIALAVPVYNFDALYADLQDLGKVASQQVWGEWTAYYPDGAPTYSQITLEIAPRVLDLRAIFPYSWNPARTFSNALRFSVTIFRTLLDAAIWLVVLIAPFVLLFLGLRFVIRRLRQEDRQS